MMRSIVGSSLKFRLLVVALAAATLFLGITQLRTMPMDTLPEFTQPYVEIQTEALGLSADEVEQLITVPLEADLLNGVAWLETIRSESVPGLSSIVMVFQPGTDLLRARQLVAERLTQAHALPNVSKPPAMLQPLSSSSRVMMIGLSSKDLTLIEQSVLTRWTIRPRLMGVPGVANVAIWGQRERQLQVQVDPDRLRAHKVSLLEVIKTTGNALWVSPLSFLDASTPGTGGFIDTPNQRLGVRHVLPITTPADLARVTIEKEQPGGPALRLGDVADVVEDHQPLIGDASVNDGPGLMLVVEKFPEANTLEVTRGVEAALESLEPGLSGMEIDSSIFRPASFIETAMDNLVLALLLGLVLLLLVLAAFLFNWRTALISLVAILVSLAAAGLVLHLRGATLNAMVLAGLVLAVAIVVDDAIVDVEHIARRLREQRREDADRPTVAVILEASLEVRGALLYATLIILLAVLPVLFLGGLSGAFLKPLALSYGLAVLASMVVALTVTPALSVLLLPRPGRPGRGESPLAGRLLGGYHSALARAVAAPRAVFLAAGVIVLVGLAVLPLLSRPQSTLPSFKERDLLIRWDGTPGTSGPEMTRVVAQASRELRSLPGVRNVGGHVGRAVMSDQVVGINSGELWVSVDPKADYDKTVASIQEVVDGYPGLERNVLTYLKDRTGGTLPVAGEALTQAGGDAIVVRVYGQEQEVLRGKADEVRQALARVDGVVDPKVELQVEEPTLEVEVDLDAAQRYGIKPGDVRRAAATMLSGIAVGSLFEEQKVFDVQVWSTPETRHSLTSVRELLIDTPGGGRVRLGDVAEVRVAAAPNVIKREAVSRRIDVGASVQGRDLGAVVADVERTLQGIQFPLEYHAELLGDSADRQAARQRVVWYAAAAAIGIFLLLQAAFGSWRLATAVFLTLPVALAGGVLAALAGGGLMSLGAVTGFFAVLGIAARNGILLVSRYRQLERDEGEPFGPGLVLRGARERLVPILAAALAAALALVPLVVLGDDPGREIVRPMAVVVLGGLVTSTLLSLFVVPTLYLRLGSRRPGPEPFSGPQVDLTTSKVNANA